MRGSTNNSVLHGYDAPSSEQGIYGYTPLQKAEIRREYVGGAKLIQIRVTQYMDPNYAYKVFSIPEQMDSKVFLKLVGREFSVKNPLLLTSMGDQVNICHTVSKLIERYGVDYYIAEFESDISKKQVQ